MDYKVIQMRKKADQSPFSPVPQYDAVIQAVPNWFERHILRKRTVSTNYTGGRFVWYNTETGQGPIVGHHSTALLWVAWWGSENAYL